MEASLQKLHEAHGAMLGMVLEALKLLGNGRCVLSLLAVLVQKYKYWHSKLLGNGSAEESFRLLQRLITLMETIETVWWQTQSEISMLRIMHMYMHAHTADCRTWDQMFYTSISVDAAEVLAAAPHVRGKLIGGKASQRQFASESSAFFKAFRPGARSPPPRPRDRAPRHAHAPLDIARLGLPMKKSRKEPADNC